MKRNTILILATLILIHPVFSQELADLRGPLSELCKSTTGKAGIFVLDLNSGQSVEVNADTLFPTASIVKIPIMVSVMDQIAQGNLSYHQKLVYEDSLLYAGSDILGSFKTGEEIALDKVMMLMLTMSDNTASLWLQHLGGTGTHINELMSGLGLENTRMNSRTPGRQSDWEKYGWGQTTPREMAELVTAIWKGEVVSPAASERMLRNLKRNYWDTEALMVLPPYVNTFSKNGAVSASRSEVVLVNAPNSNYVFCVMTDQLEDTSWEYDNAGWKLIRQVSAMLYRHFEPDDEWEPVLAAEENFR